MRHAIRIRSAAGLDRVWYRLLDDERRSPDQVAPGDFRIDPQPGDRVLDGIATDHPTRDLVRALLRALEG